MVFFPDFDSFKFQHDAFYWFGLTSGGLTFSQAESHVNKSAVIKESYKDSITYNIVKEILDEKISELEKDQKKSRVPLFAVFDTETSGNSKNDFVIQLAVVTYDNFGNMIDSYNKYWSLPSGSRINPMAQSVHKISHEMLQEKGISPEKEFPYVLNLFSYFIKNGITLVAHNVSYDNRMLKQTVEYYGFTWPFSKEHFFCTQKASRYYVRALDINGNLKAPKNIELYKFITGGEPEGDLHDALVDCSVTAAGYLGGKKKGLW
jgi:DNA polymerase III epsilon subunit-like protein